MENIFYKSIFLKTKYKKIKKHSLSEFKKDFNKKYNLKDIKKVLKYNKNYILFDNYIYLNNLKNIAILHKSKIYVFIIFQIIIFLSNNKKYKEKYNEIIDFYINKLDFKIIEYNNQYFNEIIDKLNLSLDIYDLIKIIGCIFSSIIININPSNGIDYYNYGYYLFIIFNIHNSQNMNYDLEFFREKLKLSYKLNHTLSKITPIFYNHIIIKNNKKLHIEK